MRTQFLNFIALLAVTVLFTACEQELVKPQGETETKTAEIVANQAFIDNATFNMFGDEFKDPNGRRVDGLNHRFEFLFQDRETIARVADGWNTCATIQILQNDEGHYKVIFDFGDGCTTDNGYFEGKVSFTGYKTETSGYIEIEFENFYHKGPGVEHDMKFTLTGYYKADFEGHISYHENGEVDTTSSYIGENFEKDFQINWADGITATFASNGTVLFDRNGFDVTDHSFSGVNRHGDSYSGTLVETLVYNYDCQSRIFIDGSEQIQFNEHSALVDFGNGECDNIFTLYLQGVTIIIDLDEINS